MSVSIKVDITRLPHGEGLALPAYQTAEAAGLDLLAAVATDTSLVLQPGKYAMVPTGLSIALPPGSLVRLCQLDVREVHVKAAHDSAH